ncbi:MAG: phosphotransferase [Woeseiaceae bacterium]
MSSIERAREVIVTIPGWEGASVTTLPGGITNKDYLVETERQRGVLKFDASPRSSPLNSRAEEAAVQKQGEKAGLANAVLYFDETTYLVEYVEGDVWTPQHLDDDANLIQLAGALRKLHAMPLTGRVFDAISAADQYRAELEGADASIAKEHVALIESMRRPMNLCCCHNDLVAANVLATPDLKFLDWEYARDNDPFFDLATVVEHHGLSDRQAELLLHTYFDGDGRRWERQLADQRRLYQSLLWLWSAARSRLFPDS